MRLADTGVVLGGSDAALAFERLLQAMPDLSLGGRIDAGHGTATAWLEATNLPRMSRRVVRGAVRVEGEEVEIVGRLGELLAQGIERRQG